MGLLDDLLGRTKSGVGKSAQMHNDVVGRISGGNMADLRDVGKPGEIAALAGEFGRHALPGATPVVVRPQRLIRRRRVSAWQQHGGRSISGKLMAEQKRLSQRDDLMSQAGALTAGFMGGALSIVEVASDILPGKRFEGRRHDVPGLLDKDTTWAFRAGAAATMLIPVAGPAGAAGRGAVGAGMRVAPRATGKVVRATGKGITVAGRGTRATGKLVIGTGKRAGRLAAKPVTIPARAAIGSGKYIIRKGGKVYRFTTLKAAGAFAKKTTVSKGSVIAKPGVKTKIPNLKRPGTNALGIKIPTTKEVARYRPKSKPIIMKSPRPGTKIPTKLKEAPRMTKAEKAAERAALLKRSQATLIKNLKKRGASTTKQRQARRLASKPNGISGGQVKSYFARVDPAKVKPKVKVKPKPRITPRQKPTTSPRNGYRRTSTTPDKYVPGFSGSNISKLDKGVRVGGARAHAIRTGQAPRSRESGFVFDSAKPSRAYGAADTTRGTGTELWQIGTSKTAGVKSKYAPTYHKPKLKGKWRANQPRKHTGERIVKEGQWKNPDDPIEKILKDKTTSKARTWWPKPGQRELK